MGSYARFALAVGAVAALGGCQPEFDKECSIYDQSFFYVDADGDGFGSTDVVGWQCNSKAEEESWSTNNVDCDDTNNTVNPGQDEICDLTDNDCNGLVDEIHPKVPWYPDDDGDGFGASDQGESHCMSPGSEFTQLPGDCNDQDPDFRPTAPEVCDGLDNDCDGRIDDRDPGVVPTSRTPFFRDRDEDGYGDPSAQADRCEAPAGFVDNALDCDDRNPEVNPDAKVEECDFIDNDCDGLLDDFDTPERSKNDVTIESAQKGSRTPYPCDTDNDNYGDADNNCLACRPTQGIAVTNVLDCDDTDILANIPQNWYDDVDEDGVGAGSPTVFQCLNPNDYSDDDFTEIPKGEEPNPPLAPQSQGVDCEPKDQTIYPGAHEVCGDNIDQDCSDADCSTCQEWLNDRPTAGDGVFSVDLGNFNYVDVYCDMTTDGGGWTLVSSTTGLTPNDQSQGYFDDLTTLFPGRANPGLYNGLRSVIPPRHDLRFACKTDVKNLSMDVDLSFYEVPWYRTITVGADFQSDFSSQEGANDLDPPPARRDNIARKKKAKGDQWGGGFLEGEDYVWDTNDFSVDFDDRGCGGNSADGTDWGEWNGSDEVRHPVVVDLGRQYYRRLVRVRARRRLRVGTPSRSRWAGNRRSMCTRARGLASGAFCMWALA